jgi:hypothetical protein
MAGLLDGKAGNYPVFSYALGAACCTAGLNNFSAEFRSHGGLLLLGVGSMPVKEGV